MPIEPASPRRRSRPGRSVLLVGLALVAAAACHEAPQGGPSGGGDTPPSSSSMPLPASMEAARQRVVLPGSYCGSDADVALTGRIRQALVARLGVRPGDVVVDIGAGHGPFTLAAAGAAGPTGRVIATDLDEGALAVLRDSVAQMTRSPGAAPVEVRRVTGPRDTAIDDLPPGSVDLVVFVNVFGFTVLSADQRQPLPGDRDYLARIARVLKPGGRFFTHLDWVAPSTLRGTELTALMVSAGFEPDPEVLPLPADMPDTVLCRDGSSQQGVVLSKGYALVYRRAGTRP